MKIKKSFDCVAFKRQTQARIYRDIKNLKPEEEIAYFMQTTATGPFADLIKRLKARQKTINR